MHASFMIHAADVTLLAWLNLFLHRCLIAFRLRYGGRGIIPINMACLVEIMASQGMSRV
jgi:hypothetical protein